MLYHTYQGSISLFLAQEDYLYGVVASQGIIYSRPIYSAPLGNHRMWRPLRRTGNQHARQPPGQERLPGRPDTWQGKYGLFIMRSWWCLPKRSYMHTGILCTCDTRGCGTGSIRPVLFCCHVVVWKLEYTLRHSLREWKALNVVWANEAFYKVWMDSQNKPQTRHFCISSHMNTKSDIQDSLSINPLTLVVSTLILPKGHA